MQTTIDEIESGIYRISTFLPAIGPTGFTFNQFLVMGEEPFLFHCGQRALFPAVSAAIGKVMNIAKLRWIGFSHVEADECGALDQFLAAAPQAQPAVGRMGVNLWLGDTCDRPSRVLADDEVLDIGGRRLRRLDTPHVPHNWEAGMMYEETTGTLFSSDIFTQVGAAPALTENEVVSPAIQVERAMGFVNVGPNSAPTLRRLGALKPKTLAIMHGPSFRGDCAGQFESLAQDYEKRLAA
jgi:flavorubredoxin